MTHIWSLMATGELIRVCGCKGIRTCLRCEDGKSEQHLLQKNDLIHYDFVYDPVTKSAVREENSVRQSFQFPGVFLWESFVSEDEERELVAAMDENVWRQSQSGRRKQVAYCKQAGVVPKNDSCQIMTPPFPTNIRGYESKFGTTPDFGPKVNFKKQKVRAGDFTGLPAVSCCLVDRMRQKPLLASFKPVEQCNLDYDPIRGSAIDPHLDDSWLWGEHLVTINLLSNTVLTMSLDQGWEDMDTGEVRVAVHLPRRSLVVLFGEARHRWKHAICRKDVHGRRVCSTFRELSAEFLPGGEQEKLGSELLDIALKFKGTPL